MVDDTWMNVDELARVASCGSDGCLDGESRLSRSADPGFSAGSRWRQFVAMPLAGRCSYLP